MWWVRLAGVLLLPAVWAAGEIIPDRYIVRLSHPPDTASRSSRAADQQARVRMLMRDRGVQVRDSVRMVANALLIETDAPTAAALNSLPDVTSVVPVELLHLYLDRAAALSRAPETYEILGGTGGAGAGIKIAILDTGIETDHPGFQDQEMQAPEGYPQISPEANRSLTNGKVIVARSYEWNGSTALDRHGHGTAVAMAAAGRRILGPRGFIMGIAPKAWIGVYRVSIGSTGSIPSDYVLKALDDAVADGMDVINMSFGQVGFARPSENLFAEAIARARARGVVVVCAAGNSGSDPMTVDWTASLPDVLAVGASDSDRVLFNPSILLDNGQNITAMPGSNTYSVTPVQGHLISVSAVDPAGTACSELPKDSLAGQVALIGTGDCTEETKINAAQTAGAAAVVLMLPEAQSGLGWWDAGSSTLPAWMVSYNDSLRLRAYSELEDATVTLRAWQAPLDPNVTASFSSRGPSVEFQIKPDLVAVGARFLTAGQTNNPGGVLYSPSGFLTTSGTSFSAPVVTGAVALLKAARPGLTEADYRSLLVNAASPLGSAAVQTAGAGRLDLAASLQSQTSLSPVSLSFGTLAGNTDISRTLTVKNLSTNTEVFALSVQSQDTLVPALSNPAFSLEPGGTAQVALSFPGTSFQPGSYQGTILVNSTAAAAPARAAYWFGVRDQTPVRISVPAAPVSAAPGDAVIIRFRIQDACGLPLEEPVPLVAAEAGNGAVDSVQQDPLSPGTWAATLRLGPLPGTNLYRLASGEVSTQVIIQAQR